MASDQIYFCDSLYKHPVDVHDIREGTFTFSIFTICEGDAFPRFPLIHSLFLCRLVITLKSKISAEELPAATMRPGTEAGEAGVGGDGPHGAAKFRANTI